MHPNQPPNYPGNQPPNYPPGSQQTPSYPPGAFPHFPIYQAGMPHPYMPPTTPQYPQPGGPAGGAGAGGVPPNFMNQPNSSVKHEPAWSQDARYGMGAGPSGAQGYGGYMGMSGMEQMGGDPRNAEIFRDAPTLYPTTAPQPNASQSLLAQHLASAPLPPSSQPIPPSQQAQQQPHLSQLLQQPYPGFPGTMGSQMAQGMQDQVMANRLMQAQMHQRQQQALQAQHEYMAHQQQQQQQQQTRAAQLQAEQAAAAAALASVSNISSAPPQAQGFPPSASSSQSLFQPNRAPPQDGILTSQMMPVMTRESPHQKDVDLETFSTGELCQYGRELVNELNGKTSQLSFMLKKVMERKALSQGENPNELAEHCNYNMQKMSEIRQIIEKRRLSTWKRLTGDEYIELMLDDSELSKPMDEKRKEKRKELEQRFPNIMSKTPPNEGDVLYQGRWISEALHKKYMRFEANKQQLTSLASQLKALAWKVDVTSPAHLKKVDQTKISKKKPDSEQQ